LQPILHALLPNHTVIAAFVGTFIWNITLTITSIRIFSDVAYLFRGNCQIFVDPWELNDADLMDYSLPYSRRAVVMVCFSGVD
jgi:hypothetical protein